MQSINLYVAIAASDSIFAFWCLYIARHTVVQVVAGLPRKGPDKDAVHLLTLWETHCLWKFMSEDRQEGVEP